jgi:hypothetical protein
LYTSKQKPLFLLNCFRISKLYQQVCKLTNDTFSNNDIENHSQEKKQEGHDGPEDAHLYTGPGEGPILTKGLLFE